MARRRPRTRRARRNRGGRLVWRFLLGQPLDGRRYSDATFWRRGGRIRRHPWVFTWTWWTLAAGWQRAGIRLAAVVVLLTATLAALALAA
ncbi:hypothetical protein RB614_20300 [Phytohabitans sp. ZYX-F-186]|uniref:DUF5808 domain-containing protein n=1 Tax=Phytohabitans maris TaxID=3071409 RepID=A0ABU0ZKS5_9ACTN|nr:hypothetical protein [Phytohabitans sp. ZYX-F-186]MDQ7906860.1 hypothetical protein [Phytohabitans sp. ZYX-F-186]